MTVAEPEPLTIRSEAHALITIPPCFLKKRSVCKTIVYQFLRGTEVLLYPPAADSDGTLI